VGGLSLVCCVLCLLSLPAEPVIGTQTDKVTHVRQQWVNLLHSQSVDTHTLRLIVVLQRCCVDRHAECRGGTSSHVLTHAMICPVGKTRWTNPPLNACSRAAGGSRKQPRTDAAASPLGLEHAVDPTCRRSYAGVSRASVNIACVACLEFADIHAFVSDEQRPVMYTSLQAALFVNIIIALAGYTLSDFRCVRSLCRLSVCRCDCAAV
jgi:hypothetical protein